MGSLRRKTFTNPLPDGAELFTRKGETFAKWRDRNGKTKTAPVTNAADASPQVVATANLHRQVSRRFGTYRGSGNGLATLAFVQRTRPNRAVAGLIGGSSRQICQFVLA